LNERSLDGSELLVRQGDLVEQMIFVRSGRLAMYRSIDLDACREAAKASATSKKKTGIIEVDHTSTLLNRKQRMEMKSIPPTTLRN